MRPCREEVLAITKELVHVNSVVNTNGEKQVAQYIFHWIKKLKYFQLHETAVMMQKTMNDQYERYNVLAYVRGTKSASDKTIILMGHLDTVEIDDFAHLKKWACSPDELMEKMKQEAVPPLVREHLHSNGWLFGRGSLDMKSGLASHLYLLKYYSEHPEKLSGNIVLIAECDEEDSSHGILSALKALKAWKKEHQFNYIAAINADFVSPRFPGDENRYIYKGTVGKLLPSFFITGAETHVGSCFEGLDPNYIAAYLTKQINYNPALCNEAYGEITTPPVSLKQTDLKPFYTVQTALAAYVYYNFFVHSWSPKEVLVKLKNEAIIAFQQALADYKERYKAFCRRSGDTFHEISWKPRVLTYKEMERILTKLHGQSYIDHMEKFKQNKLTDEQLDVRMFAAAVVEEAWKWMEDKSPAIILFYSSLYSPRVEVTGEKSEREKNVLQALDHAVAEVQPHYPYSIVTRNFFPYISDMSFVSLSDDEKEIQAACDNNPSWGTKHYIDYQHIRDLNIPVINIGPYGYDAHKKYERVELEYSFNIVPNLTFQVIKQLLASGQK
ncbi:M20/M25/M40 family metallo-hydrolase [Bacillus aquiflavi]|uniref:M20/M25/M40 family metallo-hydrolase n=1 Tax=Bacillus aquiflavi TaxID=2672567 RepID=A0A6B3VZS7_9BACI|nr:M20/M25/M40 family metallo-hydrolase [Bacillus aquiflavi]MBA4536719.1 M20/M25/M40 family metallo-hydrolase [Bacillus aquiflavi]NEY81086.1 M20/M25/M40 family metallo-hydrolase [Bacillus aquiflavi]UAC48752.1 M20/M25/M40 family metallo-hydrolase [Bacillus aquiflavi]